MPDLIMYGMLSTNKNALAGNLVKARCSFCGNKYGSIDEARKCEEKHIKRLIAKEIEQGLNWGENNA